jgi:solute carrier family 15 (peptide/histidine transporter), member 3/4
MVYTQMATFLMSQAKTMDRCICLSFRHLVSSLTVLFVDSIQLTVPIYDHIVVPITCHLSDNPHGLTPLQTHK